MNAPSNSLNAFGTLVISGGSSGIGNKFIRLFLKHSPTARVFNLSRTKPDFSDGIYNVDHLTVDFTDRAALDEACAELVKRLEAVPGPVLLVNNSGFGSFGVFNGADVERDGRMIDVNVRAPMVLTGRLWDVLKQRGGMVVNIASTAAYQPTPFFATYGASKAFLAHWSLALWRENLGTGIHVLTVCPGPTSTTFFRNAGFSERPNVGRGMGPERVARMILEAVRQKKVLLVCGFRNRVIAAFAGVLPKVWVTRLAHWLVKSFNLERFKNRKESA